MRVYLIIVAVAALALTACGTSATTTTEPTDTPTVVVSVESGSSPTPTSSQVATPEALERTELECENGWVTTTVKTNVGPVRVGCAIQPVGTPVLSLPCGPDFCEHRSREEWIQKAEAVSRRVKVAGFTNPCELDWVVPAKYNIGPEELAGLQELLGCEK